jgi:CRP/FNR family cyclic AMP-dependent transcriptional regulator
VAGLCENDIAICGNLEAEAGALDAARLEQIFAARGWLSLQPAAFRTRFLALGRPVELARDAPLFHEGNAPGGVYGIVSGAIAVLGGTDRQQPALAHIERAGDWFGHGPVLSGGSRTLTFAAVEPSLLWQVPLERLRPLMQSDPEFAARLAQMADVGSRSVVAVARDLLIPDSGKRVAAVLLRVTAWGEVPPDNPEGYLLSQAQLGEMANLSRHHVNRVLRTLQAAGMVACGYSRIRLLDVAALSAYAYAED